MNKSPILVVMAAGLGSRFGGIKQMASFGEHGECIIDYSLYDAYRAGFRRVVFIVSEAIKDTFREKIGVHVEKLMEVHYVVQRPDTLPEGCTYPEGRQKPWGTGHAIMCCRDVIDAPFAAINGDDFYGRDAFEKIYAFLTAAEKAGQYAMVGFEIRNTVSENGYVSRGVCTADENGYLASIIERTHIISTCDGPMFTEDGTNYIRLAENTPVSMNLWGFTEDFMAELWKRFPAFWQDAMANNPMKGEYFLPFVVNDVMQDKLATARLLHTDSKWYGVTYQEDLPAVKKAIGDMIKAGEYPSPLFK
ncbi:MAG: nucleotidyltransferase [Clostridia bacterium]|nr:nucleotidyltransferase [Clostridia bacterium]